MEVILQAVAVVQCIPRADIISTSRLAKLVHARHLFMYLAYADTLCSTPQIAGHLRKKDHVCVLHGIQKIVTMLDDRESVTDTIDTIAAIRGLYHLVESRFS